MSLHVICGLDPQSKIQATPMVSGNVDYLPLRYRGNETIKAVTREWE